jgi:hypothetical protein
MAHVSVAEVQHWLDPNKLRLDDNDQLVEDDEISPLVLGRLAAAYNVTGWDSPSTTPSVVRKIIAMLIAGNKYNKVYSETDDAGNRYASKLEGIAWDRVNMVVSGQISLFDATGDVLIGDLSIPKFWPDDDTGRRDVANALGVVTAVAGEDDIKFRMSQIW